MTSPTAGLIYDAQRTTKVRRRKSIIAMTVASNSLKAKIRFRFTPTFFGVVFALGTMKSTITKWLLLLCTEQQQKPNEMNEGESEREVQFIIFLLINI